MARYRALSSISHGQKKEGSDEKLVWNINKGQTFDPSKMGMDQAQVDRLVKRKAAEVYDGGGAVEVTPTRAPAVAAASKPKA